MAFRRRSSFGRFSGRRRSFRRSGKWSGKKWIGSHNLVSLAYQQLDPMNPQTLSALPTFIPLVRYTDYGNEALSPLLAPIAPGGDGQPYNTERQERVTVLRSMGTFKHIIGNLSLEISEEEVQVVYINELWWYFAAYSEDDTLAAAEAVTTGGPDALAQYDLGLSSAPPLWRSRMFKHGTSVTHGAYNTRVLGNYSVYHSEQGRSWDFRPRARLSTPMNWYLVMGGNCFIQSPAPFPAEAPIAGIVTVMARTLITD